MESVSLNLSRTILPEHMQASLTNVAVEQLARDLIDARNRADPGKFASLFETDAEFTNVEGKTFIGKNAIEQFHRTLFSREFFKKTRQEIEEVRTKTIQPELVTFDLRWRTEGAVDMTGHPRRGLINAIASREGSDVWRIKLLHNMQVTDRETSMLADGLDISKVQHDANEFSEAFARRDFPAMVKCFAEDATYMPVNGETVSGHKALENYWRDARENRGVKEFEVKVEKVESSGDLAYEIGTATAHVERTSDGQTVTDHVRYLVVWKRQADSTWRILIDISNRNSTMS